MEYTTPSGFRDVLADEAIEREAIARRVQDLFARNGYVPLETPTLERMQVMEAGGRVPASPFKFFDATGDLVTMRPDVTLQIARMCATRLRDAEGPLRFRYMQRVFRDTTGQLRADVREKKQVGIECIGQAGAKADAQIVALFAEALEVAGVRSFTLSLANVGVLHALLEASGMPRNWKDAVLEAFHQSNFVDLDALCSPGRVKAELANGEAGGAGREATEAGAASADGRGANEANAKEAPGTGADEAQKAISCAAAIAELSHIYGGREAIQRVRDLVEPLGCAAALEDFEQTYDLLVEEGHGNHIVIDFSVMSSFDYYTGMVFEAFAKGLGSAVGSGGRYDSLLATYGCDRPAAGFAFYLDDAMAAAAEQEDMEGVVEGAAGAAAGEGAGAEGAAGAAAGGGAGAKDAGIAGVGSQERPLRIAVPKGSLNKDSIAVLAQAGLDVTGLDDPGRSLIISNPGVDYIIVRPSDAPIFVETGAADCGICGEDSLLEVGGDVVELADLRFGACRFIVAQLDGDAERVQEHYRRLGSIRVATKYPRIAREHFARRGTQVEIVQLHGNIELGPLIGMSECIVDITATGTTLRENNLVITDEVLDSTARFFANTASFRTDARVRRLARELAALAESRDLSVTPGGVS